MLPERRAGATLGDMQLRSHLLDAVNAVSNFPKCAEVKFPSPAGCGDQPAA
jgi:hypothetical protein